MAETLYTVTLDSDSNTSANTYVNVFNTAALTMPDGNISRIRVTFYAAASEPLTISNAYIGHGAASGDQYDFAATPVQLLFSASASTIVTAGTGTASDWANFAYNKSNRLAIAFYGGGGGSSDGVKYKTSVTDVSYYYGAGDDAATVDKTGYSTSASSCVGVGLIEVETSSGGWFMFF